MNAGVRGRVQKQFDLCLLLCKHIKFCTSANKGNMKRILRGCGDSVAEGTARFLCLELREVIKTSVTG